jgi:hypothetical protein
VDEVLSKVIENGGTALGKVVAREIAEIGKITFCVCHRPGRQHLGDPKLVLVNRFHDEATDRVFECGA